MDEKAALALLFFVYGSPHFATLHARLAALAATAARIFVIPAKAGIQQKEQFNPTIRLYQPHPEQYGI